MNEKNKMITILIILALAVAAIAMVVIVSSIDEKKEMDKFEQVLNSEGKHLILIGRDGCYYCQLEHPIIDDFNSQYEFGYLYINTDLVGSTKLGEILDRLEISREGFGTPVSAIVENGKTIDRLNGAGSEKDYFDFLKRNGIITTNEPNLITYVDYTEYTNIMNAKKPGTIMVIGDSHDEKYLEMMKYLRNIKAENNIPVYYFGLLEITTEAQAEFADVELPTMIVFNKDGQKITLEGNKTYEEYVTFLENNGIIK